MDHLVEKIEHNAHNAPKTNATTEGVIHYAAETADLLLQLAREVEGIRDKVDAINGSLAVIEMRLSA